MTDLQNLLDQIDRTALPQLAKALQAVMELHKPVELYPAVTPGVIYCSSCWDVDQDEAHEYPCDTAKIIQDGQDRAPAAPIPATDIIPHQDQ